MKTIVIALAWLFWVALQIQAASADGWTIAAPREEIRPQFDQSETGGKSGHGALAIRADEREGLHGWSENLPRHRRAALPLLCVAPHRKHPRATPQRTGACALAR